MQTKEKIQEQIEEFENRLINLNFALYNLSAKLVSENRLNYLGIIVTAQEAQELCKKLILLKQFV